MHDQQWGQGRTYKTSWNAEIDFRQIGLIRESTTIRPWDKPPKGVVSIIIVKDWDLFDYLMSYKYADGWKFALARCLVEKVEQGQRLCLCEYSNFLGLPTGKGMVEEGGLSIFLINLNPIYVLVKLELGTYANWLVID